MEGGKEQNYWPGFVDVLSNVVLTLVFVLVVFVIALSLSANKVEKKLQEVIEQKKKIEEQTTSKKAAAPISNEDIVVNSAEESKFFDAQSRTEATIIKTPGKLVVHYASSAGIDLDEKSAAQLEQALAEVKKRPKDKKILINSYLGDEPYSVAQRMAYYRALYVRKFVIDKGVTTSDMVHGRILQNNKVTDEKNQGYVEILLDAN